MSGHRPLVLVAEDNLPLRRLITIHLEAGGFEVVAVADGQEALEVLDGIGPVALVTDLRMPRLNGLGLVKRVRAQTGFRSLPVLVITDVEPGDPAVAVLNAMQRVRILHKPPVWTGLVPLLRQLIESAARV